MILFSETKLSQELEGAVEDFKSRISQLRAGRARPDMFEGIMVEAYGMDQELKHVANVVIESASTVSIVPWDKSIVANVVKSIEDAQLGYSPVDDGGKVRINIPPLTEERRKESVKDLNNMKEDARVRVRHIRQSFMEDISSEEGVSEDDQKMSKEAVQKQIDEVNKQIDEIASEKEKELMTI